MVDVCRTRQSVRLVQHHEAEDDPTLPVGDRNGDRVNTCRRVHVSLPALEIGRGFVQVPVDVIVERDGVGKLLPVVEEDNSTGSLELTSLDDDDLVFINIDETVAGEPVGSLDETRRERGVKG